MLNGLEARVPFLDKAFLQNKKKDGARNGRKIWMQVEGQTPAMLKKAS